MKAGETERFDCSSCNAEFEVTFEPKAKDDPAAVKSIKPADVTCCPFCGDDLDIEGGEDEE